MKRRKNILTLSKSQVNRRVRRWIEDTRRDSTVTSPEADSGIIPVELMDQDEVIQEAPSQRLGLPLLRNEEEAAQEIGRGFQECEMQVMNDHPTAAIQNQVMPDPPYNADYPTVAVQNQAMPTPSYHADSTDQENVTTKERIARWADRTVPEHKVDDLLSILIDAGLDVPATAKTLRKTRRIKTPIRRCAPGEYFHYGLQKSLEEQVQKYDIPPGSEVEFDINLDGLKLSDRSKRTLWPILGKVVNVGRQTKPFVIGVYHGFAKPRSAKTYLKDFVKEYKKLNSHGFYFESKRYTCTLKCAICDAPARSFVKCTAQHNGFYGCDKCRAKGRNMNGRMCYLNMKAKRRTNMSFRTRRQKQHHLPRKRSIFEWLRSLDMIRAFPQDPMHMLYLGDVKYLLNLLSEFNDCPDNDVDIDFEAFNKALEEIEKWIPAKFCKKRVKDLKKLGKWKATHGRFFLLYASIPLVYRFLPKKYARHMYKLTCAIRILSDPDQYKSNNAYADALLREFVQEYKILYGEEYLVYNIHSLLHLAEEALANGPLDSYSAFPFENYMKILKSFIRKPEAPLQQIHLGLKHQADFIEVEETKIYPIPSGNSLYNLPLGCTGGFSKIIFQDYELSTSPPNNVCIMNDGTIVMIEYFGFKDEERVIIGKRFERQKDVPLYPVPSSSHFMISIVSKTSSVWESWPLTSIYRKAVTIVYDRTCYVIPLLHSELYTR